MLRTFTFIHEVTVKLVCAITAVEDSSRVAHQVQINALTVATTVLASRTGQHCHLGRTIPGKTKYNTKVITFKFKQNISN